MLGEAQLADLGYGAFLSVLTFLGPADPARHLKAIWLNIFGPVFLGFKPGAEPGTPLERSFGPGAGGGRLVDNCVRGRLLARLRRFSAQA